MQVTIDIYVLVAILIAVAVVLFGAAFIIEGIRRRRNRVILEPLIGVVLPRENKKRRSTYIAPQRKKRGRHAR